MQFPWRRSRALIPCHYCFVNIEREFKKAGLGSGCLRGWFYPQVKNRSLASPSSLFVSRSLSLIQLAKILKVFTPFLTFHSNKGCKNLRPRESSESDQEKIDESYKIYSQPSKKHSADLRLP